MAQNKILSEPIQGEIESILNNYFTNESDKESARVEMMTVFMEESYV